MRSLLPARLLRWYAHRRTDVYLISYPKCGRTWLRLMIGRAICRRFDLPETEEVLFLRSNRRFHPRVPRILVIHDDRPMLKAPEELARDKSRFRDKKVIFLVRDPRDVIVSSYFEMKNRGEMFGANPHEDRRPIFDGSLEAFIDRREGGFETILAYYNLWAQNRDLPRGFLLVRYEDMKADSTRELRRVIDFLGLAEIPDEIIAEATHYAAFENMRKMEARRQFETGILRPANEDNLESYKTRKGKIKGYLDYLSADRVRALNALMRRDLSDYFGYQAEDETNQTT